MLLSVLVIAVQLQIPAPQGYVNDFAGLIDSRLERAMTTLITEVQQKTGGEIAVVTLRDLEGRASIDVARDIGRQWGIGAEFSRRAVSLASAVLGAGERALLLGLRLPAQAVSVVPP